MTYSTEYQGLETSDEIIQALEELYQGRACDESTEAHSQWEDPNNAEAILTRAWELANDETEELYWGVEKIRR